MAQTLRHLTGATDLSDPNDVPQLAPLPAPVPVSMPADMDNNSDAASHLSARSRVSLPRSLHTIKSNQSGTAAAADDHIPAVPALPAAAAAAARHPASSSLRRPITPASARTRASSTTHVTDDDDDDDFAWGPQHPCFPHPNPHCAPDSTTAQRTRVIRVRRDWLPAGDLYPQFANLYPEILDPLVPDAAFRALVTALNAALRRALDPRSCAAALDAALGLATGFVYDDCGAARSARALRAVDRLVDAWNADNARAQRPVRLVALRRTGFTALDFVIPDPGIDTSFDPAAAPRTPRAADEAVAGAG